MTPHEFVAALDEWSANGGPYPDIPRDHKITSIDEAKAICRAVSSSHIYTVNNIKTPALFYLAAYFQSVRVDEATDVMAHEGLPVLRRILLDALDAPLALDSDDRAARQRVDSLLFLLKILALYGYRDYRQLLVRVARDPRMAEAYGWTVIFTMVDEPLEAVEICNALENPLPEGFVGVAYLDFTNTLARWKLLSRHPFDSQAGIARLVGYLADRSPKHYSYAVSAVASIPFINDDARAMLMTSADQHPDWLVRLEAAWALAKTGSEFGRQRLAQLCLNPRFTDRAMRYLEELGHGAHIPARARDPDFQAMAKMCTWLTHPNEFNRPPDEITQYDTRELNWPPTGDRRRLWLFKYRYQPQDNDAQSDEGIGLVGSITFTLVGEATAALPAEDVYALHCCWELKRNGDPKAPEQRTAAAGRKILAESNPGFAGA